MEMLSTLQLVARLLQMKTQSHTHTYRHRDTHTHFQTSAQQPQSYSPVSGPLTPGCKSYGRGSREGKDLTLRSLPDPHPARIRGLQSGMLFWEPRVRAEKAGTPGHP